ncbi:MAG: TonB-dependent receptor [Cytophagales bacterium]|nr:TonB-dependent receptor [Cytophagales bacterium]
MKQLLLSLAFVALTQVSFSQTLTVKGRVLDAETKEALIGVSVLLEGTNKGTITDLQGNFSLKNVQAPLSLRFRYIGYQDLSQELASGAEGEADLGEIMLPTNTVNLKQIEVFASVVEDRKTPVAVSSISAQEIDEQYVGVDVPDMINNTPGIYATQGAGGFGDNEIYIRGFDQTNVAFLINGVPVNDMENGRMYWSNYAGINDVMREMQVQRGLGASKLAISSIGGTINMISKPAERQEGGRLEYQTGTGTWNQKMKFSYNSGESAKGWALSFVGSRVTTNSPLGGLVGTEQTQYSSIIPGGFVDNWSYYLALSKKINPQHTLHFWAFGSPTNRGTRWVPGTQERERYKMGAQDNLAVGYRDGELYNVRQNKINKPLMALTHYWDINPSTSISTSLYYSYAKVYSTQPVSQTSGIFDGPRNSVGHIDIDSMIRINQSLAPGNPRYYIEARYNNHQWVGLISNFHKNLGSLDVLAGVDLRTYKAAHYAEIFDLLGADYALNNNRFGDSFDKLNPNDSLQVGDKTNYNYDGIVNWGAAFAQAEYTLMDKLVFFATVSQTLTSYQRQGNFWSGSAFDGYDRFSLGPSEQMNFHTGTYKAGLNYRITGRHNVFSNLGFFTRPPFHANSFVDSRYSNRYLEGLTTEKVTAAELGYGYRSGKLKVNLNAYITSWRDRTTRAVWMKVTVQGTPVVVYDITPRPINGLQAVHQGLELDFEYNLLPSLELSGYASLGDWYWTDSASLSIPVPLSDTSTTQVNRSVDINGLPASGVAQTTLGLSLFYNGIRNTYVGGRWNYFDRLFPTYSPDDLLDGFITPEVIQQSRPAYSVFSVFAGRYFDLSDDISGRLSISVQNVFNTEYIRWSGYFNNQFQDAYGFPRTYIIGLSIQF